MNSEKRTELITRETIMQLLSDEEIARVSTAEGAARLSEGEEYVDLQEPEQGIRRAHGVTTAPMGHLLPRKAVRAETWRLIEGVISAHKAEASVRLHVS